VKRLAPAALASLGLAAPALAADGVIEINQACAKQTGCFENDTANFPVTIDGKAGKSYRLTSDLVVPDENTTAIRISADDVSIDLAGFEILGPMVCSGVSVSCVPAFGTGSGIEVAAPNVSGIWIHDGSVRGMGAYGVFVANQSTLTNLRVRSNRLSGATTSFGSHLSRIVANENGFHGIAAGAGSTVVDNAAFGNGGDGLNVALGSTVSSNAAYDNVGDGIQTGSGCVVKGNAARSNTGFGLNLGSQTGYRENVVSLNAGGTIGGGTNAGDNVCNGSLTCP
jgi:hypothetical protein